MFKLIRLELRKINLRQYVFGALAAIFILAGLLFFAMYTDRNTIGATSEDFFFVVDSTRMVFIVFAGILISRLFIEEYNDKNISLMFTYPISRKRFLSLNY